MLSIAWGSLRDRPDVLAMLTQGCAAARGRGLTWLPPTAGSLEGPSEWAPLWPAPVALFCPGGGEGETDSMLPTSIETSLRGKRKQEVEVLCCIGGTGQGSDWMILKEMRE